MGAEADRYNDGRRKGKGSPMYWRFFLWWVDWFLRTSQVGDHGDEPKQKGGEVSQLSQLTDIPPTMDGRC